MPTFNGAFYIREQLESILASPLVGEIVISDDGSSDDTLDIVRSIADARVRVVEGPRCGLIRNYEYLFSLARGEYIFLADQDDVWLPQKVELMFSRMKDVDLVVSDCIVVDAALSVLHPSFFSIRKSAPGFLSNLWRNSYLGCCMAFRRTLLDNALPLPRALPMHDWWLGLIAEAFGRVAFIDEPLVLYRRHGRNVSPTAESSTASVLRRSVWRMNLLIAILGRVLRSKLGCLGNRVY